MIGGRLRNTPVNLRLPEVRAAINPALTLHWLASVILMYLGITTKVVHLLLRPLVWLKLSEERVFPALVVALGVPGGITTSAHIVELTTRNRQQLNSENTLRAH